MNLAPPTVQLAQWREIKTEEPLVHVAFVKGFCEGCEFAEAGEEAINRCDPMTVARVEKLRKQVKTIIDHLQGNNSGLASDEFVIASREYNQANVEAEPLLVLSNLSTVFAYLVSRYLSNPTLELSSLYHCERFTTPPIPHFRAALYTLMILESDPKQARSFLLNFLSDDRELIFELMEKRDPKIRSKIDIQSH